MSTYIAMKVEDLGLNQKINLRGRLSKAFGLSYVNYTYIGEVFFRSPLLANFRAKSSALVELPEFGHGVYSDDIEYIADAIEADSIGSKQFIREGGDWIQDESELDAQAWYYAMMLVNGVWCYAPKYGEAMALLRDKEEKNEILENLLRKL